MEIQVVNVKCSGCGNTVKKELGKIGIKNIDVLFGENNNSENRTIKFDGDFSLVKEKVTQLGYPEVRSEEAKSFVSCAIGKMSK